MEDGNEALLSKAPELVAALGCCSARKCGECPYRGHGIACKYRLMMDAAALIEAKAVCISELEAQHRTEFCEEAQYDCVLLGRLRAKNEAGTRLIMQQAAELKRREEVNTQLRGQLAAVTAERDALDDALRDMAAT